MEKAFNSPSGQNQDMTWTRLKPFISGAGVLVLLGLLSLWGGVPTGKASTFWPGVLLTTLILIVLFIPTSVPPVA